MNNIIYRELSYKITGICFKVHRELGRFCKEKQYADRLEKLLRESKLGYRREIAILELKEGSPEGNKADFIIEEKIIIDLKAKRFITKEDYYQMQRYLQSADLELGLIINFRNAYLKPKRVLNSSYSGYSGYSGYSNGTSDHSDRYLNHSDRYWDHSDRTGYIALITVLIIGAIGVAIGVSVIWLGIGGSKSSFALEQSNQAKALANACSEEALQQIRDSTPFTGTGSLTLGQGTCSYTVTSQGGQNRTITSTGTVGTIVRKVKVIIDKINPSINITSWQEVADF